MEILLKCLIRLENMLFYNSEWFWNCLIFRSSTENEGQFYIHCCSLVCHVTNSVEEISADDHRDRLYIFQYLTEGSHTSFQEIHGIICKSSSLLVQTRFKDTKRFLHIRLKVMIYTLSVQTSKTIGFFS